MTPRKKRLCIVLGAFFVLGILLYGGAALWQDSLIFSYTPTAWHQEGRPPKALRLSGLVVPSSLHRMGQITFTLSDGGTAVPVRYQGPPPPPLFQEGQGALVEGTWTGTFFQATRILAKHDEIYQPKACATP